MKKRTKFIIIIILLIIIPNFFMPFTKMTRLSEDEIGGLDTLYEKNDTILFVSDSGAIDTIRIFDKYDNNRWWPFTGIQWFEGFDEHIASVGYNIKILHMGKQETGCFYTSRQESLGPAYFWIAIADKTATLEVNTPYCPAYVKGVYLYNIWRFGELNTEQYSKWVHFNIESFVWSKSIGLISYKYVDGETYYLKDLETKIRTR